ncbi:MAG: hypothetical protein H6839_13560 [Planctomycetes bacterium]|nr:hypothetical protein [Planctomycetota bacterium]
MSCLLARGVAAGIGFLRGPAHDANQGGGGECHHQDKRGDAQRVSRQDASCCAALEFAGGNGLFMRRRLEVPGGMVIFYEA